MTLIHIFLALKKELVAIVLVASISVILGSVQIGYGDPASTTFRLLGHDNINHEIITINTETGQAILLGATGFSSGGSGLATSKVSQDTAIGTQPANTHFGVFRDNDDGKDYVVIVNPVTGESTKVVEVDMGTASVGVAFFDGEFYITNGATESLFTVDLVSGLKVFKGFFKDVDTLEGVKNVNNLQLDPETGKFLAIGVSSPRSLYSIDPSTAASTKIAELSPPILTACALARAPDTGEWFSISKTISALLKIDIDTGEVTVVGNLGPASSGNVCGTTFTEFLFGPEGEQTTASSSLVIPDWIRNNANWWSEGAIADRDFISGIQYLIKEGIMQIPETTSTITASESNEIPSWIKNNADWWSQGVISDDDFVKGIQYLVEQGIIKV